jgi:succinoglycan biosynthesis transport protein ExoP
MALTDRVIRNAKPRNTVYRLRDGNSTTKGFGVTIAPAGSKTFFLGYTSPTTGKRTQINLGRFPETSLKEAREKAKVYRNRLTEGLDPKDDIEKAKKPDTEFPSSPVSSIPDESLPLPEPETERTSPLAEHSPRQLLREDLKDQSDQAGYIDVSKAQTTLRSDDHYRENEPAPPPFLRAPHIEENTQETVFSDNSKIEPTGYVRSHNELKPANSWKPNERQASKRGSYYAASSHESEQEVSNFLYRLWVKKGLIFATILVCMAATMTILFQITPRYFSESLVMIEPTTNKVVDVDSVVSGLSGDTESIQSEIQVILSRDLVRKVIIALNLDTNPEFNSSLKKSGFLDSLIERSSTLTDMLPIEWLNALIGRRGDAKEMMPAETVNQNIAPLNTTDNHTFEFTIQGGTRTIEAFHSKVSVRQKGLSRVIGIGTTSVNPALTAKISNTLAKFYIDQMIDQKVEATQQASSWLDKRISVLQEQVAVAEAAVEKYRARSGLLEARGSTVSSLQVAELSTQLIIARTNTAETKARLEQTTKLIKSPKGILSSAEVLKSPFIQKLREKEAEVQHRAAELSNEYGDRHPVMISVLAEIVDINTKIRNEAAKIINGLQNEVKIAQARERTLSTNLENVKNEVAKANKADVKLRSLEREATASRSLLETFLSRYKETSAQEDQDAQTADARIISLAGIPLGPTYPKKGIVMVLSFVGSFGLGVLFVFLTEFLDKGFRNGDQIEEQTGFPVFGLIPLLSNKYDMPVASSYVIHNPVSQFSEAVRTIYTSLLLSHVDKPPSKVLITSSQPDEGKTTLTMNLARMQALAGSKVVIIEADLRRPGITTILNLEGKPGLVELLMGEVKIEDVLYKDPETGVLILPAGKATQNPPTLLSSDKMTEVLATLDQHFDVVFLDSPPALAVSDARILATKVDSTVFVVRWADTSREMVKTALKQLDVSDDSLVGIVMSMVDLKKHLKYKYSDSYYYQKRTSQYYTYDRS